MSDLLEQHGDTSVLVRGSDGATVATVQDALDLVGATYLGADAVAVAADRFDDRFFDLESGFAGEVMQKFVNYRVHLVIVGDISRHLEGSRALRALVHEANQGRHVWFVDDMAELDTRLGVIPR
jgi:hypothetical protein